MKIKTNLRAGKGGASGTGQNSKGGTDSTDTSQINNSVVTYYNPGAVVSRCPGY